MKNSCLKYNSSPAGRRQYAGCGTMKTTGKYVMKRYKCKECGHESMIGTNHWGECYPRCRKCGWKRPMEAGQTHECLEKPPKGYDKPKPWKRISLGEVCEVKASKLRHGGAR
ncbi:MAG: hypothetical protein KAT00_15315 [Planctomycetes bacterium]|nr:hypothetical protein [Planctomycetota bacterium]